MAVPGPEVIAVECIDGDGGVWTAASCLYRESSLGMVTYSGLSPGINATVLLGGNICRFVVTESTGSARLSELMGNRVLPAHVAPTVSGVCARTGATLRMYFEYDRD